jgi:hypothetical protein
MANGNLMNQLAMLGNAVNAQTEEKELRTRRGKRSLKSFSNKSQWHWHCKRQKKSSQKWNGKERFLCNLYFEVI